MANVKNFGLVGVGSNVQFSKGGARIRAAEGGLEVRNAADGDFGSITLSSLAASSGNITATLGNIVASSNTATFGIGGDTTLSRQGAGVFKFDGSKAMILPSGNNEARPTGAAGMVRYSSQSASGIIEYFNGTTWVSLATGGEAVTAISVVSANGFTGTSSGGTTPALTLTTSVSGILQGNGTAISAATTTGSGDVVLATSPTLVTPTLGAAAATSINKVAFTAPATGATLALADGSTLTTAGAFATTITSTATTSVTLPTSGTLLSTDTIAANAVTSFNGGTTGLTPNSATQGAITLGGTLNVANGGTGATTLTANGVVFGNGTSAVGVTAAGTQYQVLRAGSDGVPSFGSIALGQSAAVSGTLGATNGGTGLSSFSAGSVLYASANNTWAAAAPGATSGVQAWDAELDALAGITTAGIIVRTGAGTATTRTITGTVDRISITNGTGVGGEPTIDLATVTQASSGNFVKVTLDSYGRVTGNTAVTTNDITALVGNTYVDVAGDTMTGNLSFGGTHTVTGLIEPVNSSDAATKNYVDNVVTGLSWKQAVHVLANANVALTGGATLTIDGHLLVNGDRVLLANQTDGHEEGIYVVSGIGTAYVLTRSSDANTYQELNGAAVFVQAGTSYADTGWVQTATLTSLTTGATQSWVQFSGAGAYSGGAGITVSGTVISADIGDGLEDVSGKTTVKVTNGNAVQLVGTSPTKAVELVLDTGSGLIQSGTGLKINANSVTNSMLANSGFTSTADSGSVTLSLGNTLHIDGDSVKGLSFSVAKADSTVTYQGTIADASSSQKGVAKFSTASFDVSAETVPGDGLGGIVTIKNAGVSNAQLANSSITFAGTAGLANDPVSLGETLTFSSTVTGLVATTVSANGIALDVRPATTANTGVASFSSTNFAVADGAVSIKTGGVNLTTDVTGTLPVANGGTGATTFTAGRVLLGNGTSAIAEDAALAFNTTTDTLTVGTATIQGGTTDVTITATATNGDINLVPNGTGTVNIGAAGAGQISSDTAQSLTVTGSSTLALTAGTGAVTITSTAGDTVMVLAASNASKVTVSGPTATQYADGLAAEDLVNKHYVDTVAGSAAGDVKAFKQVVALNANGTTNIGSVLPTGATVLSVKVNVTTADTTATLAVGISGTTGAYMATTENDPQTVGLYLAECMVVNTAQQIIATVASTAATADASATVVVTYQIAN